MSAHSARRIGSWIILGLLGAVVPVATGSAAPSAQVPAFVVARSSPVAGVLPREQVAGDFDGDGLQDVAVANDGPAGVFDGGVAVILGDGTGGFGAPVVTPLPSDRGASELAAADFDEDGHLDVVAVSSTTGGFGPVFVLFGGGDGTLTVGPQFTNGQELLVTTADFDGDGHLDFATAANDTADVDLFFGDGAGSFPSTRDLNPPFGVWDFAAADLEGDGDADLIGASGGVPFTMLNNGDGTFAAAKTSLNIFGIDFALDDFDADGDLDLAMGNASDGTVFTGLGNGDGTFTKNATFSNLALQVDAVAAGDVTGDGRADVIANGDDNTAYLLAGQGNGTFRRPVAFVTGEDDLIVTTLNADDRADLIALQQDPGEVHATLGGGRFGLQAPRVTPTPTQGEIARLTGDVNGDGMTDLVLVGRVLPRPGILRLIAAVFPNRGAGRFGSPIRTILEPDDNHVVGSVRMADVNGDGHLDLVAVEVIISPFKKHLITRLGNGDGSFQAAIVASAEVFTDDLRSLELGDVNGDGIPDAVSDSLSQLTAFIADGDGTFTGPVHSGFSEAGHVLTLIDDFTGDGTTDVVTAIVTGGEDVSSSDLYLQAGAGDGTFAQVQKRTIDTNVNDGVKAPLNGDGLPDVAVTGNGGSDGGRTGMYVFLNQGGLLGPATYSFRLGGLEAADVNLDGATDLISDNVQISLNDGAGGFSQQVELVGSLGVTVVGDFTNDGRPDIVVQAGYIQIGFALYINAT
jgi:FG-GAP-like repeat